MNPTGAFRERLEEAWTELRENLGRSLLQVFGVVLGVASVLGGFSITDSQRRKSDELYIKLGGLDKLAVRPSALVHEGQPTALQAANLGLRTEDGERGEALDGSTVMAMQFRRQIHVRIRSPYADLERSVIGIGADFIPMEGYSVERGRAFSAIELEQGAPVAILGTEAVSVFFPSGHAIGQTMTVGDVPVTVVGVFAERMFQFSEKDGRNLFAWRNRFIVVPAAFAQKRLQGDAYRRVDSVSFKIPQLDAMTRFGQNLRSLLLSSHRLEEDFRLDDISKRRAKAHSQEKVYDLVFLLSGILALLGGGIVNVNITMASLQDRIREVGVKMAIGASGREIFLGFMTEALLLTALGGLLGLVLGVAFSWVITSTLGIPLFMTVSSFLWAFLLAGLSGFVFALFPAWRASRLSPMEALHYE